MLSSARPVLDQATRPLDFRGAGVNNDAACWRGAFVTDLLPIRRNARACGATGGCAPYGSCHAVDGSRAWSHREAAGAGGPTVGDRRSRSLRPGQSAPSLVLLLGLHKAPKVVRVARVGGLVRYFHDPPPPRNVSASS